MYEKETYDEFSRDIQQAAMVGLSQEHYERGYKIYARLIYGKSIPVHQRLLRWKEVCEELISAYRFLCSERDVLAQIINEMSEGSYEKSNKRWSQSEDDLVVSAKAKGESIYKICNALGRSPGAIATRISYLVGIKRLFLNVDGQIVGNLDGEDVEGHFVGKVARNA